MEAAYAELKTSGANVSDLKIQRHGESISKVFFVIAPDGLCYMIGQPQ